MAKCTPTTKSCIQIFNLITGNAPAAGRMMRVSQTPFDPISTHVLYGVRNDKAAIDYWKDRVKSIGGKYIRVVGRRDSDAKVICFALEITPEEALKVKMENEMKARKQQAYESKLAEVQASIIVNDLGATNERAQKFFAQMLICGDLDPLLPFESYVCLDKPTDKDEKRIYDIVQKANAGYAGCVGMVTNNRTKMVDLANQMNHAITDEQKRARRRAACLKYGLNFLAKCFEKAA